jgi:hypothetical protein
MMAELEEAGETKKEGAGEKVHGRWGAVVGGLEGPGRQSWSKFDKCGREIGRESTVEGRTLKSSEKDSK